MAVRKSLSILFILLLFVVTSMIFFSGNEIVRDAPRDLPWTLPDHTLANTSVEIMDDGRLKIEIEHLFLKDVKPEMIAWFYQHLPISTVTLNDTNYPMYHLFHPTEHGKIWIAESASNGEPGMGLGALVSRNEWFGAFTSKGSGRIIEFSSNGMKVSPEVAGMHFGQIHHEYVLQEGGTQYYVHSIIGSDMPVLGPIINYFVRNVMFPPEKLQQWLRHQVEEVSSLQFFLPVLYQTQATENNYKIYL